MIITFSFSLIVNKSQSIIARSKNGERICNASVHIPESLIAKTTMHRIRLKSACVARLGGWTEFLMKDKDSISGTGKKNIFFFRHSSGTLLAFK
jgi:hypothetical protein